MKDTKLLKALSTLNKDEWMSYRRYVLSRTGIDSELFSLFSILQTRKLNFESLKNPSDFKNRYFPTVSQKAFFGMLSKLYKWLEEWLGVYEMKLSKYDNDIFLIKALIRKGLVKEAKRHSLKLEAKLKQQDGLELEAARVLSELSHLRYYNVSLDTAEERHQLLTTASEKNAEYYKNKSEFYIVELNNRGKIFGLDFSETKEMLASSCTSINESEISKIGKRTNEVIQDENIESLNTLKDSLLNGAFVKGSELEELVYDYVRIYSRRLFSKNKFLDDKSYFDIFNLQLEREMNFGEKKISQTSFHNIVDQIANFVSFEKAKEFIDQWAGGVETKKPQETKDLAYSQLYFINRDFMKMFEFSQNISFDNYGQRTRAWLHNVICHFKFRNEDYELSIQAIRSFKNYLKRNKKKYSKNYFQANLNLILLMEQIIKNDYSPQVINLSEYPKIFYRKWITEEVEKI